MNRTNVPAQKQQLSRSQNTTEIAASPAITAVGRLSGLIVNVLANISIMRSVRKERRKLRYLTDDQLRDIGVSFRAARQESKRSFFDIPEERKQPQHVRARSIFKR